jgi:hypothetical protein
MGASWIDRELLLGAKASCLSALESQASAGEV